MTSKSVLLEQQSYAEFKSNQCSGDVYGWMRDFVFDLEKKGDTDS